MTTVGGLLKKERLKIGFTLEFIEKEIKVRVKYLKALEDNNWSVFSSKIYIVGIIKNYCRILNLDSRKVLAFFRRDYERLEEVKFKEKVSSSYLTPESRKIFVSVVFFSILLIFFYFSYQLKIYFSPPKLSLTSPKTYNFTTEKRVKIEGITEKDASIVIMGNRIYQNKEGVFEYDFPLSEGENRLVIELTGANGKTSKIEKIFIKNSPK